MLLLVRYSYGVPRLSRARRFYARSVDSCYNRVGLLAQLLARRDRAHAKFCLPRLFVASNTIDLTSQLLNLATVVLV